MATDTASSSSSDKATTKTASKDSPPTARWKVRLSHPLERRRAVFSSVSEARARSRIVNSYPRGTEAYLESPDGVTESYQQERTGPYGEDAEQWQPFNPDDYQPPEEAAPPGESAWADTEG
jgi:hypothetical protein